MNTKQKKWKNPIGIEIIKAWLSENGYAGLYEPSDVINWRHRCCCKIDDLWGCRDGSIGNCVAGYLWPGDEYDNYYIRPMPSWFKKPDGTTWEDDDE